MTRIEPTDTDIAEALLQMGRPDRIIDAALKIGAFTQAEPAALNFARTIAKLRVAREAVEDIADPIQAMHRYAESQGAKLSGMAYQIANDPEQLKRTARQALAHITQETHMVDGGPIR